MIRATVSSPASLIFSLVATNDGIDADVDVDDDDDANITRTFVDGIPFYQSDKPITNTKPASSSRPSPSAAKSPSAAASTQRRTPSVTSSPPVVRGRGSCKV